jgi:hypothetical protein
MQMIQEIRTELQQLRSIVTSSQVKNFFIQKGYAVCNITPISNTSSWFAILTKNKEYVIATVYTKDKEIERFEESVM